MKLPDTLTNLNRRRWIIAGLVTLGTIAGGVLSVVALGQPDPGPTGTTPSSTAVGVASATPSATATPSPTPSPIVGATEPVVATTPPADPAWQPVAIVGTSDVTGIVERNTQLFATGRGAGGMGIVMTSTDGETWLPVDVSAGEPAAWYSVVIGESGFVALSLSYPIPMGMPEQEYLYSPDGETWTAAEPPADCVSATIVARGAGFLGLGDRCRTEGDFGPGALYILESPDGRTWTSRRDETMRPGQWATDGSRIVMLQYEGDLGAGFSSPWISDDGARTWRRSELPLPDGFNASGSLLRGHDVYVAPGSWSSGGGDSQSAVCVSDDGDAWECNMLEGELAGRNWLARQVAVTPTGFVSMVEYVNDPARGGDGSVDMIMATSRDGLSWTFAAVPELKDKLPNGLAWTSHGLYLWGNLNRDITPDAPVPYLVVHEATLP